MDHIDGNQLISLGKDETKMKFLSRTADRGESGYDRSVTDARNKTAKDEYSRVWHPSQPKNRNMETCGKRLANDMTPRCLFIFCCRMNCDIKSKRHFHLGSRWKNPNATYLSLQPTVALESPDVLILRSRVGDTRRLNYQTLSYVLAVLLQHRRFFGCIPFLPSPTARLKQIGVCVWPCKHLHLNRSYIYIKVRHKPHRYP